MTADMRALPARQRETAAVATLHAAAAHSHSPSDRLAYALDEWLVTHPDAPLSTDSDYPTWAAALATTPAFPYPTAEEAS
jgi:hypothetical protein